jgi:NAD(P)-dependent dehydrogenase (short-subunit alcohol dehydrogenase family)
MKDWSNAIAPALIDTKMVRNNPRAQPDLIPVGRFGTVDEVAGVVVMLGVRQNGVDTASRRLEFRDGDLGFNGEQVSRSAK